MAKICYPRHRFSPVVIQHAVWLYLRFRRRAQADGTTCSFYDSRFAGRRGGSLRRSRGSCVLRLHTRRSGQERLLQVVFDKTTGRELSVPERRTALRRCGVRGRVRIYGLRRSALTGACADVLRRRNFLVRANAQKTAIVLSGGPGVRFAALPKISQPAKVLVLLGILASENCEFTGMPD